MKKNISFTTAQKGQAFYREKVFYRTISIFKITSCIPFNDVGPNALNKERIRMTGGGQDCQLALPHLVGVCPILNILSG